MSTSRDRTSFWRRTFDDARRHGDWCRVDKFYTRKTAAQIASDIRRAHLDGRRTIRTAGIEHGEVWEARWSEVNDGASGDCEVWIRRVH
ncbi:MAG: hypothetical protein RLZZ39_1322 [Actinomycetota bacterium]|jgi:hypothetical protein